MDQDIRNVVIVGSGPTGWTSAIYTARAGLKPLLLAGSVEAGGALINTTEVENYPGFPDAILGPDLMEKMQQQAENFGTEVLYEDVTDVDLSGDVKRISTEDGKTFYAYTVILGLGSAYNTLGIPGEAELSGNGVSYCATCDGFFFRDKEIAVVGGGDTAATDALFLTRFATKVYLIHRRDSLRASRIMADRIAKNPKIEVLWNTQAVEVLGENAVTGLRVRNTLDASESSLPLDGVFVAIGHTPRSHLVKDQIETDDHGYIVTHAPSTRTNIPGVFAAGDVVDHWYRQAVTAAGSGCAAALDAQEYLAEHSEQFNRAVTGLAAAQSAIQCVDAAAEANQSGFSTVKRDSRDADVDPDQLTVRLNAPGELATLQTAESIFQALPAGADSRRI